MLAKSTVAILITLSGSVAAIIDTTPGHAQVQAECLVTSTISGRWSRAELNCGEPEGTRPRVAVVAAERSGGFSGPKSTRCERSANVL